MLRFTIGSSESDVWNCPQPHWYWTASSFGLQWKRFYEKLYDGSLWSSAILTRWPRRQWWGLRGVRSKTYLMLFCFESEWCYWWTHAWVTGTHGVFVDRHWVFVDWHVFVHGVGGGGAGGVVAPVRGGAVQRGGDGGHTRHDAGAVHTAHVETHSWHTETKIGLANFQKMFFIDNSYLDWLCIKGVLSPHEKLFAREGEGTLAAQLL